MRDTLLRVFILMLPCALLAAGEFGKNQLLVRDYPYKIWETDHFQIHYYEDNPLLLEETAKNLEAAYQDITARLDAKPNKKLPFFLYTNHNEFEQNRVVQVGEGTGGVTEAFKDRFLVFNNGSMAWLRHVIYHEFTHEVEFAVLNSGFWKSARLLKSILYPLWLMEGLSEYMAGDIDEVTDDMYARDAATSKISPPFSLLDLHNFNHLKPNQITKAYKQGALVMKFITEEYGEEKIAQILKSFWERFDANAVLLDVLGIDLERFDRNFIEWIKETYGEKAHGLQEPTKYATRLTQEEKPIPSFRMAPVLSPDEKYLYYIAMRDGFPAIYRTDLKTGRKTILAGKNYFKLDWIALEDRNLSITADGRYLYFIGEKNLKEYLYRYDIVKKRLEGKTFPSLIALQSPCPNPKNFDEVVFSGMENGFTDIYVASFKEGKIIKRITSDPQDDNEPVYAPDGKFLVYSTEVGISTQGYPNRNLYIWNEATGLISALTQGPRVEKTPAISSDGKKLLFISDASDVWDIYEMELETGRVLRKTQVIGGVFSPSYTQTDEILFSSFRDGEINNYKGKKENFLNIEVADLFKTTPAPKLAESAVPPMTLKKYKPTFGTDLFFPAFFYSTQGGFFVLGYWQASDMLGYHNVATNLVANSGVGALDYTVAYSLTRYRMDWNILFRGIQFRDAAVISDRGEDLRKKEHIQAAFGGYPLDRFHRLEMGVSVTERYHTFPSDPVALTNLQELAFVGQFVRDTTTAPYLVVTRGSRLALGIREAALSANFDLGYLTKFGEWHQFFPVAKDSTLASRLVVERSQGENYQVFPLGGREGVRGYSRERDTDRNRGILVHNLEFRFPLFPDLSYHMWYLFPDFYFKSIYLGLFSDQGVRWKTSTKDLIDNWGAHRKQDAFHAVGLSVKFNTFILETFPFFFSFEWAKRTTSGEGVIFYGSIAQYFAFGSNGKTASARKRFANEKK